MKPATRTGVEITPVAVLGGGIAGAAACLALTRRGINPLWIATATQTEEKPGEHLAPAARPLLAALDALDLLERPYHRRENVVFSVWGSDQICERNAIVHLEGPSTVLDRGAFERDLVSRARQGGTRSVEATVTAAERRDGIWYLQDGDELRRARFLIDATGRSTFLARQHAVRLRADQLLGLYAFLERDPSCEVEPTKATLIEATSSGWWYAALLEDGRLALNFYTDPDLVPAGTTRDATLFQQMAMETRSVSRWIAEAGFQLMRPPKLASAGTTWVAPAAGAGWAAIGDAAAAFDPLSSHGITTALWSAITVAGAPAAALAGDDPEFFPEYVRKVATGVQEFLLARSRLYALESRFSEYPFWRRRIRSRVPR